MRGTYPGVAIAAIARAGLVAAFVLFVVAVPVFLATTNVRLAFNSSAVYEYGFERHSVSQATAIEPAELRRVARAFVDYFNSGDSYMTTTAIVAGDEVPLLQERELLHMRDVKLLVRDVFRIQEASAAWLLVFALAGFALMGKRFSRTLMKAIMWGSGLTLAIVAALGVGALLDFQALFVRFHLLSFSNDLWQLNPDIYILTRLFPEGFWLDAMLLVTAATLIEALVLFSGSGVFLALRKRGEASYRGFSSQRPSTDIG